MNLFASRFALLGLALSVASLAPAAFAQDGSAPSESSQHRAPDPQKQAARLAKRLGLSDDQSAKITAILQDREQQLVSARGDSSLSAQDRHAKLHAIQQSTDTQINAVLTPDQQTQYATMKQNMMNRWQGGHGAPDASSDGH